MKNKTNCDFIKLNITTPCWFANINYRELDLILHIASAATYDKEIGGYILLINGFQKKKLTKLMKLDSEASVANLLTGLVKHNIIYRIDRGTYLLNPHLVSKGEDKDCEKAKEFFPDMETWFLLHE